MKTSYLRVAGVSLAGLTATAHILVGTYDTLLPLLKTDLDIAVKGTFHACWHIISVILAFSVWSFANEDSSAKALASLWVLFGVCFIAVGLYSGGLHGLLVLPQWILLGPTGILIVLSLRHSDIESS